MDQKLIDIIDKARAEHEEWNRLMDIEETNNGYTDFLDMMEHRQLWGLADRMLDILRVTGGGE